MKIEDSSGKIQENVTLDDVLSCIDRTGNDIDHCILSEGDSFIQTASSGSEYIVEYGDASGYHAGEGTHPVTLVKELFTAFYNGDPSWKNRIAFAAPEGGSAGASMPGHSGTTLGSSTSEQHNGKESIIDTIKNEAQNSLTYMIRRAVRNLLRRFF